MPTRAERLAERAKHAKAKLTIQRRHLAQVEAAQRQAQRSEVNRRRYRVGALADEAGLLFLLLTVIVPRAAARLAGTSLGLSGNDIIAGAVGLA